MDPPAGFSREEKAEIAQLAAQSCSELPSLCS